MASLRAEVKNDLPLSKSRKKRSYSYMGGSVFGFDRVLLSWLKIVTRVTELGGTGRKDRAISGIEGQVLDRETRRGQLTIVLALER